ncbi:unnamed protein product, partial [Allacma fusca]
TQVQGIRWPGTISQALLLLDAPLTLNTTSGVNAITIPSSNYDASGPATVIGWGVTKEGDHQLSEVTDTVGQILAKVTRVELYFFHVMELSV